MVFIKFELESDPSHPLHLTFGSNPDHLENASQYSTTSQCGKQSIAIVPIHLTTGSAKKPKEVRTTEDISPIEVFPTSNPIVSLIINSDYFIATYE